MSRSSTGSAPRPCASGAVCSKYPPASGSRVLQASRAPHRPPAVLDLRRGSDAAARRGFAKSYTRPRRQAVRRHAISRQHFDPERATLTERGIDKLKRDRSTARSRGRGRPPGFRAFVARIGGEGGRAWIATVPDRLAAAASLWGLELGPELPGGLLACVVEATTRRPEARPQAPRPGTQRRRGERCAPGEVRRSAAPTRCWRDPDRAHPGRHADDLRGRPVLGLRGSAFRDHRRAARGEPIASRGRATGGSLGSRGSDGSGGATACGSCTATSQRNILAARARGSRSTHGCRRDPPRRRTGSTDRPPGRRARFTPPEALARARARATGAVIAARLSGGARLRVNEPAPLRSGLVPPHLPGDYVDEAARFRSLIEETCPGADAARARLGGGNNLRRTSASTRCTLSDISRRC
jgi:hypothetical protein